MSIHAQYRDFFERHIPAGWRNDSSRVDNGVITFYFSNATSKVTFEVYQEFLDIAWAQDCVNEAFGPR